MSGQNVMKPLLFIENVLGIHRNYSLLSKRLKRLTICRVLIEIAILIICFVYYVQRADFFRRAPNNINFLVVFVYCIISGTLNSVVAIIFGCLYSKHFKVFVLSMEGIKKICENDMLFKAKIAIETRRFYIDLSVMSALVFAWLSLAFYDAWNWLVASAVNFTMFIMGRIIESRIVVESIVFYEFIEVIGARLNYLNASISEVIEELDGDATEERELRRVRKEMEKYEEVSKLLSTACDRLRDCLGAQITLSLYCVSLLYMALLYSNINLFINQKFLWESNIWSITLTTVLYLTVKVMVFVSGQRAQREADALATNLVRLWRALLAKPEAQGCARTARSLLRRVRTTPPRVRLHDALPVRMALLVDILGTVVSYTIVLLQLSHVV